MTNTEIIISLLVFGVLTIVNIVFISRLKKQIDVFKKDTEESLEKKLEATVDQKGLTIRSKENEIFIKTTKLLK